MPQEITLTTISKDELHTLISNAVANTNHNSHVSKLENHNSLPDLLSINDMCKFFKVSRVTIHDWMKKGKFPFYKVSRRVYFKLDEVLNSLKNFNLATIHTFQNSYINGGKNNGI